MEVVLNRELTTSRLLLKPMTAGDFEHFVRDMLTDPKVVEHYHSYRGLFDLHQIRVNAQQDFWEHFEASRTGSGFEIYSIFEHGHATEADRFVGWTGLLHSSISDQYGGPELQYMIASRAFGRGYATEAATAVIDEAREQDLTPKIIATVDIPNVGSIRVLEKLAFELAGQIESYGSSEMYLYTYSFD
ncbi:MAG: GNAT family N-acetyltransferase [Woeseiaceae bacterium]